MKLHSFPPNYASKIIKDPQEPIKNTHYWSEQNHTSTLGVSDARFPSYLKLVLPYDPDNPA